MLGAAVIGLTYPFWNGVPGSEQNVIPRFANQWHIGEGSENHPVLQYVINYSDKEFLATIEFMEKNGDNEKINLLIDDKKSGVHLEQQLEIGEAFVFIGVNDDLKPYVQALDKTVFSVRDTITGSKYLVVGAEWGTTFVGKFNPKLKVVDYLDTKFQFGELKTFIISYEINQIQNKLWIVDNMPLPVKAEYFTIDGKPDFSYELIDVRSVPLS